MPVKTVLALHVTHDDVIKWNHFPCYWTFVRGIHRSPVDSPLKGQWREAFVFALICAWTNGWANNRDVGDLRHHRAHCDVTVILRAIVEATVLAYFLPAKTKRKKTRNYYAKTTFWHNNYVFITLCVCWIRVKCRPLNWRSENLGARSSNELQWHHLEIAKSNNIPINGHQGVLPH